MTQTSTPSFDEATFHTLMNQLTPTLHAIGTKLGLPIRLRKGTYRRFNGEIILEAATVSERGVVMGREAEDSLRHAARFGVDARHLGLEFNRGETRLRSLGLRPRASAPIICEELSPKPGVRHGFCPRALAAPLRHLAAEGPEHTPVDPHP